MSSAIRTRQSACPLDCPDGCSLAVGVRDGRVVSIDGDERNPLTGSLICGKVRRFAEHLYSSERVLEPALRDGPKGSGRFRPVSWDEALDRVASRLLAVRDEHSGGAILPLCYGGSNGRLSQNGADGRLFSRLGAIELARTVCAAPSGAAHGGLYGKMPGVALGDYSLARLVIVWGCNPEVSGLHLVPILREMRRRGGRLVVIDPRRTGLAAQADLHIAPRPGTDLVLALALHRRLLDNGAADHEFLARHCTGVDQLRQRARPWTEERAAAAAEVPIASIERLAEWYVESEPAVIRCGWGVERNRNGGSAVAAILALPAVGGKFGVRGGGFTMSNSAVWDDLLPGEAEDSPSPRRRLNQNLVGEALLPGAEPAIKALFVYNHNPLSTLPAQRKVRRGLEREDLFTVVHEQVLTDTALYADVLLPAPTFLERVELNAPYGAYGLALAAPVVEPLGQARDNHAVFHRLAELCGVARKPDPPTTAAALARILMGSPEGKRLGAELQASGIAQPTDGDGPVQFVDTFPGTADRKVHLLPAQLDREAPGGLYRFQPEAQATGRRPLALISPASSGRISSTFGQLRRRPAAIELHPEDAAERGLAAGEQVRVFNGLGEVHCLLAVSDRQRRGVACLEKGLWGRHTANGSTANALCPDTLSDIGGGACFNDARVEVEAL